ncbi:MAG: hypothetical protein KFF73_18175 [Cyclobacteriaceae bacterium]|nr:hypothetical protein [Cyclobacteriaceae bacterium]
MTSFRIRPRFRQMRNEKPDEIEKALKKMVELNKGLFTGTFMDGHIIIKINQQRRHFWSPQLNLSLENIQDITVIRGLYGPNPTVWAVFFFGYACLAILFTIAGMLLLSQYVLGLETRLWWTLPACFIAAAILYLIAQFGQKIGASQMFDLHHFYEETVGEKVSIL